MRSSGAAGRKRARMISTLAAIARGLFRTPESIATPCSVKARRPGAECVGVGLPDHRDVPKHHVFWPFRPAPLAAGLRAGSSGIRPDVKRPVSLAVARATGTCRQSARRRRAPTVRTAARLWLRPGVLPGVYEPRSTAGTVLHQVVRRHLERFLAETTAATDGVGVPRFIEREFRDFLGYGVLGRGFARVRCDACRFKRPASPWHIDNESLHLSQEPQVDCGAHSHLRPKCGAATITALRAPAPASAVGRRRVRSPYRSRPPAPAAKRLSSTAVRESTRAGAHTSSAARPVRRSAPANRLLVMSLWPEKGR